jgi:hypothetical protein
MEYNFNGKLSFDDYIKLNSFYTVELLLNKRISLIIFIIYFIFSIGFIVYDIVIYHTIRFFDNLLPLLIFGLIWLLITKKPKILYKKSFEENKIEQEEKIFKIDEKNIKIISKSIDITLTKENIKKIRFDKDSIFIFSAQGVNYIIKSRYLENFNELKEFIKINYI